MKNFLALGFLAILGAFFLYARKTEAGETVSYNSLYQKHGQTYGVDWLLLKALAIIESNENPGAVNPVDPSYGIMQIFYTGSNRFDIDGWPPTNSTQLLDADYNIRLGSQIIGWNLRAYGLEKGIAVYNKWSARNETKPFSNQAYVDKVLNKYHSIGGNSLTGLIQ